MVPGSMPGVGAKVIKMSLPDHWEELPASTKSYDGGRDYDKPMYIRKDGLARIYHNQVNEPGDEKYEFAIVLADGDGDCSSDLLDAIRMCDNHIKKHQAMYDSIPSPRKELF